MNTSPLIVDPNYKHCSEKCFSWSAAFVGAIVGVGLSFLLNLFSIGIGLSAFNTTQEGISNLAIGGFIGFAIGIIASMFAAGWIAGYLGRPRCNTRDCGALYGFMAWGLSIILGVILAVPVAHFVSSTASGLTNHTVTVMHYGNAMGSTVTPDGATVTTVNADKAAEDASKAAFALFALFFLGAVASCFGGHYGMACCCKKGCDCCDKKTC